MVSSILVFSQLAPRLIVVDIEGVCEFVVRVLTVAALLPGFVPAPVACQVGGAVEHLFTLRAAVLHVHDHGATMLRQTEGVIVHLC